MNESSLTGSISVSLDDVLRLYSDAPRLTRAFLRGRAILSDLEFVEGFVPDSGDILDLGCGHGLLANLMALRSPARRVIGIDIDCARISEADRTIRGRDNVDFLCTGIEDLGRTGFAAVTIADVLYLLPREDQVRLLGECYRRLAEGGILVWKAQETRPLWKYAITYAQEFVATSSGLTRGKRGRMAFMSRGEALVALGGIGFEARAVEMKSRRPYADVLYLGVKKKL